MQATKLSKAVEARNKSVQAAVEAHEARVEAERTVYEVRARYSSTGDSTGGGVKRQ